MRAGDAERIGYRGHRTSLGNEVERKKSLFAPAARDTASRSSSFSMAFLPSSRCNSRTYASSSRYSDAGTTSSPAAAAASAP